MSGGGSGSGGSNGDGSGGSSDGGDDDGHSSCSMSMLESVVLVALKSNTNQIYGNNNKSKKKL